MEVTATDQPPLMDQDEPMPPTRFKSHRMKGDDLSNVNGMIAAGHDVYLSWIESENECTALLISEVSPREFGNKPSDREVKFVDRPESRLVKADDYVWIHIIEARRPRHLR
jgi:hypothetical protein